MGAIDLTRNLKLRATIAIAGITSCIVLSAFAATAPGYAPYTATRLEWASLELQATYGTSSLASSLPIQVHFVGSDGFLITCTLSHRPDYSAEQISAVKNTIEHGFEKYRTTKDWGWMRLKLIDEPTTN